MIGRDGIRGWWRDDAQGASLWPILVLAGILALALVLPAQAVVARYVNDLLIFLDGAYRVNHGQVPNRDFHTALGPLNFYLPALAARLTGTLGTAMPVSMALLIAALAPAMAHIVSSRLRPVLGIPFAAFLLLIIAMPANLGEAITDLSYGMFYNRIGWAALAALILMHLRPTVIRPRQGLLDTLAASLLVVTMIYTKASYGAVGAGFLVLMLLDRRQRAWALAALGVVLATGLAVEAVWRGGAGHIADLRAAMVVSGNRTPVELTDFFLRNLADYVLLALVAIPSLWRTRSPRDALLYGFCAGAGLMLISQNFQGWGIITIHAGAVVAAERLMRTMTPEDVLAPVSMAGAAPILMLALILPTIVHATATLALSTTLSAARAGEPFGLRNYEGARLAFVWNPGDAAANGRYLATLREGVGLLTRMDPPPHGVFTLDFVNPFSSAANLAPPQGDTAWQHWGRNVNEYAFVPPDELFRAIEVVMEPKAAIEGVTGDNLRQIYGAYLAENYALAEETGDWRVFRRNPPDRPAANAMLRR
ncbi:hypothetical protein [Salinarimonas soli]|uniref:Glycosyltransferase RgtA/B/C/D-like domain-containing protein n=1 Tax=Salinarimonas soli TaxID=1638099 RepID=A0A5B2V9F3_9HYPH|nr:hypothetical protein [Salinarimonas soli]KAA2234969.1 hypothetical protein F0L46_21750 [Salinarimonas soli]